MHFTAKRRVFALQVVQLLLSTKKILARPDRLEQSAFADDCVYQQDAAKEYERQSETSRATTILLQRIGCGQIGNGGRIDGHAPRQYQSAIKSTREKAPGKREKVTLSALSTDRADCYD